jgi:mono/diheme cytochrome c family protein
MRTTKTRSALAACLGLAFLATGTTSLAEEMESSMARGGKLYDRWYKVVGADKPTESHPLYPSDKGYADDPGSNWRCKECHGWDYKGKDGAYASGKHASGIGGITGAQGAPVADIVAALQGAPHNYGDRLGTEDYNDLANFVSAGQIDMDMYIDSESKAPKGDAAKGEAYYNTICANCHGKDGKEPDDMKPFGAQMSNPWEVMHKILNGQPDENMPALRALDHQITADIMAHMVTLPKE